MTIKNKINVAVAIIGTGAMLALGTFSAFAEVNSGIGLGANAAASGSVNAGGLQVQIGANADSDVKVNSGTIVKADTEIENRIGALNGLEGRINAMQKLSSDEKSNLSSLVQAQISAMTNLESQIKTDNDDHNTSSLRADIQSITKGFRIYALVLPQGQIAAASDRVMTITGAMGSLAATLQTRISAAQAEGANMSSSVSALADLNAKIADANIQAQAATNETASLKPDNGSSTVMNANTAILKDARTKIQAAQKDLIAARADAMLIVKAIKVAERLEVHATTTASTTNH
jgi:hypothetical protein